MYLLTVELKDFSSAHRLIKGYKGKCNHLHGHNYALKVVVGSPHLGDDGLVVDFSTVRRLCDDWVQGEIDHCTLVCDEDTSLLDFVQENQQKHYTLYSNTTVEAISKEIYDNLSRVLTQESERLQIPFYLQQVEVWESKRCGVIYSPDFSKSEGQLCGQ